MSAVVSAVSQKKKDQNRRPQLPPGVYISSITVISSLSLRFILGELHRCLVPNRTDNGRGEGRGFDWPRLGDSYARHETVPKRRDPNCAIIIIIIIIIIFACARARRDRLEKRSRVETTTRRRLIEGRHGLASLESAGGPPRVVRWHRINRIVYYISQPLGRGFETLSHLFFFFSLSSSPFLDFHGYISHGLYIYIYTTVYIFIFIAYIFPSRKNLFYQNNSWPSLVDVDVAVAAAAAAATAAAVVVVDDDDAPGGHGG